MGDSALTEVLLKDVRNYAARKLSGAARLDESRIRQAADSILEEIATYHMHSDGYPVFHIYPGGELDIMIALRSHYLTPDVLRHFDFIAFDVRSGR
jgi:hypothetical protein